MVKYYYDAWGNYEVSGNRTLGNLNPFRYRSYYFDTETGSYFLQTRYYDPVVGRFLNMDGTDYADPRTANGLNLYAYCGNNSVMYTDPTGEFIGSLIIGALLAGVISGTIKTVIAAAQGESALSCLGAFVGGFITGAALGAATVLGGGLAVGAFAVTASAALGITAYLTVGTFALGVGAYYAENAIKNNPLDPKSALVNGAITAVQGLISFCVGAAMGASGFYNSLKPGNGFSQILSVTKDFGLMETGKSGFTSVIHGASIYFSENASAMALRSIIKGIFTAPFNFIRP